METNDPPADLELRAVIDRLAGRLIQGGIPADDLVKEMLGCAATITVAAIGTERARQYFATVALHAFPD